MATTTRGVPYPLASGANNVPADLLAIANYVNDAPGVAALTTTQRNALAGAELWDGRVVLNTTTDRLNRYDLGTTTWIVIPDNGDIAALLATTGTPAQDALTASRGVSASAARADHVHPTPAGTAYTPTYSHTLGAGGSTLGRYQLHGKWCQFWAKVILGTGFTIGSAASLTLPFTARTQAGLDIQADANLLDSGTTNYRAIGNITSGSTSVAAWVLSTNGQFASVTPTVPFTWVANDAITFNGAYEIA